MGKDRQKAYRTGFRAELLASMLLLIKGYRILERRYKTPVGEIDLIARKKGRIAFVEVKARRRLTEALLAVSPKQCRRIRRAADFWRASQKNTSFVDGFDEFAFDVITVAPWRLPRHYKDAFSHATY